MFLGLGNSSSLCLCPQLMLSHSGSWPWSSQSKGFPGYSTSLLFPNTLLKLELFLSPTKQPVTSGPSFIELESQRVNFPIGGDLSYWLLPSPCFQWPQWAVHQKPGLCGEAPWKVMSPWATPLKVGAPRPQDVGSNTCKTSNPFT